jgi:hypothetical protein
MLQIARNMTDAQSGALHAKRYLIIDWDTKYSTQFRRLIACLDRMIFVVQASLRRAVCEYVEQAW